MEKIVSLCKRRGFVYPSSEIYGGFASVYDYGPLGVELKNNIKKAWWKEMVQKRENIVGLDSAIFMHPKTWEASGHTQAFSDPLVEDKVTHERYRLDQLLEAQGVDIAGKDFDQLKQIAAEVNLKSFDGNELTEAKKFNLLVEAYFGVTEDNRSKAYLRGETCQGIYLNYENVLRSSRQKIPFGIAQIGKAFRNEITPGNFIFRTREFEQMEME
ncbi:MAG: Glycine-tRNA ligase, partial [candidate division CPR1 bacterium GW2011_GWA2_42_17]